MTGEDFEALAVSLVRSSRGWVTALARRLGCDRRAVARWAKDGPPPAIVADIEAKGGYLPPDEWAIAEPPPGGSGMAYLIRLRAPRALAIIPPERGERVRLVWIDQPRQEQVPELVEAARAFIFERDHR